jgi:RimJ/RimL family protein N-acetyltransferase
MVSGPGLVPFTTEFGGGGFGDERRRIHIRPIQTEDAPPLFAAVQESLEQLRAWMTWCGRDYAFEHCQSFVSNAVAAWDVAREFSFVILDSADGTLLGSVGINQANHAHNFANLGYWVRGSRTCRGVASAAVKLVARFGFQELGLTRLELLIPTKNLPSQRVAVKAGAQREGILRQRLLLAGELHDAVLYSLVPGDLQSEEQDCHSVAGVPA